MKLEDIQVGMKFKHMGCTCTIKHVSLRKENPYTIINPKLKKQNTDIDLNASYLYYDSLYLSISHVMSIEKFLERINTGEVKLLSGKRKNNYY